MLMKERGKEEDAEKLMCGELKSLYLWNCGIGDDEAVKVAAFIKVDESMEQVHLNGNIESRGAKAIADALKHNKTLCYLNLVGNQIGDQGAEAFIDALSHNVCITKLFVFVGVNIGPDLLATIEYLTETRNDVLIPAAARRASLYLIATRRATPITDAGHFAIFPKEIVRLIAMAVWATRKDPKWIEAIPTQRSGKCSIQ
jgi:hypothetical protein